MNDFESVSLYGSPDFTVFHFYGKEMISIIFVYRNNSALTGSSDSGTDVAAPIVSYLDDISNIVLPLIFSRINADADNVFMVIANVKDICEGGFLCFHRTFPPGGFTAQ